MSPHRRSPRPLTFALEAIAEELAPESVLADVQRAWRKAVGESIAAQAQPTAEHETVTIPPRSASVWAQELDLMAPEIIERLNELLRRGRVQRLRCVAVGPLR